MDDLDKAALGERVRRIRTEAGLRQWELARRLGTTQSAVHKYEHGVVPEPRRLIELARIGATSVEWILTGRHWENGSEEKERVSPDLLATASALRRFGAEERDLLSRALRIVRDAAAAVTRDGDSGLLDASAAGPLPPLPETSRLLHAAARIQDAVARRLALDEGNRLESSALLDGNDGRAAG
jgi:transcriptional regulator with XRE-family HTH domain